ncbi:MAG: type 4a pilus biogenesis protein PilO, partial [Candidatus Bathyarchaeota archaeon]|nr:type 4a pilus biogenesis protein PilO [Candidatus Bathyarchaeota archaeon]
TNPLRGSLTELKEEVENKRITLEITKRKAENLSALQEDYKTIEAKKQALENMIISQANQLKLFQDLEDLAQKNNIEQNFSLETPEKEASPQEVKININLEGNYLKILGYLAGLEAFDYYVKVFSIRFTSSEYKGGAFVTIEAKTYWQ